MMNYGYTMGPASWIWMTLTLVTLAALLVAAVVAGVRLLDRTESRPASAEDVVAERFSRGEITEEDYARRMAVLHAGRR
jgi:putative membrane protein